MILFGFKRNQIKKSLIILRFNIFKHLTKTTKHNLYILLLNEYNKTTKNKIQKYESHTLTSKPKVTYDIHIRFEDNNIILLDDVFYIFIVMFVFNFKCEENNDLVSNNDCLCFHKLYFCN